MLTRKSQTSALNVDCKPFKILLPPLQDTRQGTILGVCRRLCSSRRDGVLQPCVPSTLGGLATHADARTHIKALIGSE